MTADARHDDDSIHALPAGTRFGELEILGTLGVGGFGIVYLARDHSLEREVAIKEYMPSQFALRDGASQVSVRSMSMRETFELGRRSFVNEAKLLARFDHPSLLKVYRFWEANGTAYMAMPRLVGQNLREARKGRPTPPPEAWTRRIFDAILGGLETLHAQHVWHRDVAPDNIFLPADGGPPILLDFGAARQAIGDRTQVFTAILKPSYAPIEQYAEATSLKQGPWTDFYALAAAMHDLLIGRPPPPCTARAMGDELAPLTVDGYSPRFLAALDWALRVPPQQRPQSAAAWREVIDGRAPIPAAQAAPRTTPPAPAVDVSFADTVQATAPGGLVDLDPTIVVPVKRPAPQPAPVAAPVPAPPPPAPVPAPPRVAAPPPSSGKPKPALLLGAGAVALVLLGFFVMQLRDTMARHATPSIEPELAAASAVPAAPGPEPAASAAVAMPASAPASQPVVAQVASAPKAVPVLAAASAATRPASAASVPVRREAASKPGTGDSKLAEARLVQRPAASEPAAPSRATTSAKAAASAAPIVAEPEPRSPSEACGRRVLLALAWCIDRQCERPLFQNHPECVRLREIREQRREH
jgi:hypothetical protein